MLALTLVAPTAALAKPARHADRASLELARDLAATEARASADRATAERAAATVFIARLTLKAIDAELANLNAQYRIAVSQDEAHLAGELGFARTPLILERDRARLRLAAAEALRRAAIIDAAVADTRVVALALLHTDPTEVAVAVTAWPVPLVR